MELTRSSLLLGLCATAATLGASGRATAAQAAPAPRYTVSFSDDEWRKRLSPEAYDVLRHAGTELPFSSPLDRETRPGRYACAACALPAYDAKTKFDSGTGWPSFYKPLPHAVATTTDRSLLMERTEVHCSRCGSHLGHVFDDGPKPTGLRYCMNGVALAFHPARR
jgi:peptide-methionine (R)-S-oxide reductase